MKLFMLLQKKIIIEFVKLVNDPKYIFYLFCKIELALNIVIIL